MIVLTIAKTFIVDMIKNFKVILDRIEDGIVLQRGLCCLIKSRSLKKLRLHRMPRNPYLKCSSSSSFHFFLLSSQFTEIKTTIARDA